MLVCAHSRTLPHCKVSERGQSTNPLLYLHPPVRAGVMGNPWLRLATAMLMRCPAQSKEDVGNEVLRICRSLRLSEQALPVEVSGPGAGSQHLCHTGMADRHPAQAEAGKGPAGNRQCREPGKAGRALQGARNSLCCGPAWLSLSFTPIPGPEVTWCFAESKDPKLPRDT